MTPKCSALNAQFRGKNYATDVLSFPALNAAGDQPLGDIAISLQRARAQARELATPSKTKSASCMLHGVLHLLGMDHESDAGQMKRAETRWRKKLGLPTGLIERDAP